MSHEPIILDRESWPEAHAMVQYNLNRCVANIHDERERLNGMFLEAAERRERDAAALRSIREADMERIGDRYDPLFSRMSAAEARAAVYGAVAGIIASGVMSAIIALILHK